MLFRFLFMMKVYIRIGFRAILIYYSVFTVNFVEISFKYWKSKIIPFIYV